MTKRRSRRKTFQVGQLYTLEDFPAWLLDGVKTTSYARCLEREIPKLPQEAQTSIASHGFWRSTANPGAVWYRLPQGQRLTNIKVSDPLLCVDTLSPSEKKQQHISKPIAFFAVFLCADEKCAVLSLRETNLLIVEPKDQ